MTSDSTASSANERAPAASGIRFVAISCIAFAAWLALFSMPSSALADMPPPSGYVEQCTMQRAQGPNEECVDRGGWHGDKGIAGKYLAEHGFCRRCQTYGASSWGEIHCGPKGRLPANWRDEIKDLEAKSKDETRISVEPECPMPRVEKRHATRACGCYAPSSPSTTTEFGLLFVLGFVLITRRMANRTRRSA